ncbi:MAG TPA: pyridoxal phosphate-dependent aminotransferase family protein, partial [Dyadobacter sp.]|nr:pyridoxal phosphate-dependent aminotransferase family protein [Dyadobacter sp.]
SLNKGMGIPAGVIYAEPSTINQLAMSPWFSAASPALPASMYALKMLLKNAVYDEPYRRVIENTIYFLQKISGCMYLTRVSGYPVMCSKDARFFDYLLNKGILASRFPYPSADDEPVTRIALSALHQKEDLDRMAEVCISFQDKFKS